MRQMTRVQVAALPCTANEWMSSTIEKSRSYAKRSWLQLTKTSRSMICSESKLDIQRDRFVV